MKPLFTIHAGEYLVGSYIEKKYRNWHLWVPSKDTGIDLLVTNKNNSRTTSIQVKFSKDYVPDFNKSIHRENLSCSGWWTLNQKKLYESKADYWVFVINSYSENNIQYVIISPKELYSRLKLIHSSQKEKIRTYLLVTKNKECWEIRGIDKKQIDAIGRKGINVINKDRKFSRYLNNWKPLEKKLG